MIYKLEYLLDNVCLYQFVAESFMQTTTAIFMVNYNDLWTLEVQYIDCKKV